MSAKTHLFDIDIAAAVGVNAAVIYSNIQYWCDHSRANEKHFHDGRYWTFNSIPAFAQLYPYMTEKQIRTALKQLLDGGYIAKGNYNTRANDRTNWYTDLHNFSAPHRADGNEVSAPCRADGCAPQGRSYKETVIKPVRKNNISRFSEFWEVFADKRGKEAAQRVWKRKGLDKIADEVIAGARAYASSRPKEREFWKMAQGWLNDGRWQDQTVSTGKVLTDEDKARLRAQIPRKPAKPIKTNPPKFLEKFERERAANNGKIIADTISKGEW
jgi:hypothetical protein